jgi:hypothetical protein
VLVSTEHLQLRGFAKHFQVGLNNLLREIGIEHTLRRWVMDAFFCVGIVKVHMASSGLVEIEKDLYADPGKPFASNISLDNWVYDTSAVKYSEVQFAGDVYRIPHEDLLDPNIFNQDVAAKIQPSSKHEADGERVENMARGYSVDDDEYLPMVDLIDIWLPREGKIETYGAEFRHGRLRPYGEPLAEMEWEGSEFGNYKVLTFGEVPDNIMPASPASHLAKLAKEINNVYRKQIKSCRDYKEVTTYAPGDEKSARNFMNARHGESVSVQDPSAIGVMKAGGVDQETQMFLLNMQNDFNTAAGNLTAMLGLGAQADTVGQEKLIHGAVGGKVAQMGQRVGVATESLVLDLGRMMWNDQVNIIPGQMEIDGLDGYVVDATWTPDDREGDFIDYNLRVDVYSMAYKSPQERANAILQLITQVYAPMSQMLMAQGGMIDFQKLNAVLADLMDLPRLREIVQFQMPMDDQDMPGPQGKPSATTREYIRRSVSTGGSAQGRNIAQQQMWAGQAGNGQQQMMSRPQA